MNADSAATLSATWLARIAQSLKLGADLGAADAEDLHEEMWVYHGPAESTGSAVVPLPLIERMETALRMTRKCITDAELERVLGEEIDHVAQAVADQTAKVAS